MERSTNFNGKTHYFYGHVQVRKLLVITRGNISPTSELVFCERHYLRLYPITSPLKNLHSLLVGHY